MSTKMIRVLVLTCSTRPGALGPAVYAFTHGRGAWRAELVMNRARQRGVRH